MARLSPRLYRQVATRARDRCEYCGLPQAAEVMDLTVDHVVPRAGQGSTELSNLALACLACHSRKWKFTQSTDSLTGRQVPLDDPRRQRWQDHFRWIDDDLTRIEGKTATGRATVELLQMNSRRAVQIRRWLMFVGLHPLHETES